MNANQMLQTGGLVLAMVAAPVAAAPPPECVVELAGGDRLHGVVEEFSAAGGLVLRHAHSQEPLRFRADAVANWRRHRGGRWSNRTIR
jgi:hypothetical protein